MMVAYHDHEWGRPVHDDRRLFEMLVLEGAQAGLSWRTVLAKRDAYRRAFAGFDPAKVARFDAARIARLMNDPGIVRNRAKIASAVRNARAFLALRKREGSFDAFVWRFAPSRRSVRRGPLQARTPESDALSKALSAQGFNFVGSTICHAFMQAVGMVDDHANGCAFRGKGTRRNVE